MTPTPLSLRLDRSSDVSLVEQIRTGVQAAVAAGTLAAGARLPSTRELADTLDVNRQTAIDAYRRLEIDGLIEQRRGAGAFVRAPGEATPSASRARKASASPRDRASEALLSYERRAARPALPQAPADAIDLGSLSAHERDYPSAVFEATMRKALTRRGGNALGYGPPAGDPELRELIAERLRARGLAVDPAGILVVGGAQHGLDLLFRALLDPGDVVLTEAPTYHMCLDLLAFHRARIAPVPVVPRGDAGLGTLDLDALKTAISRERPALAYVMPSFQNPTGLTLDVSSRRALASTLRAAGVALVEDDYEADMRHAGEPLPPVSSLPEAGESVYLGTLSKSFFPGLRIGWLAGSPELLGRVAQVKRVSDLSGSIVLQAVAAELLKSGAYDKHVAGAVADARERMTALLSALRALLPEGASVTSPQGGHVFWLQAPALSGRAIAEKAAARGVIVTPGEMFAAGPMPMAGVRVSVARVEKKDVARAAERLAAAVKDAMEEARGRASRDGRDAESPVSV